MLYRLILYILKDITLKTYVIISVSKVLNKTLHLVYVLKNMVRELITAWARAKVGEGKPRLTACVVFHLVQNAFFFPPPGPITAYRAGQICQRSGCQIEGRKTYQAIPVTTWLVSRGTFG